MEFDKTWQEVSTQQLLPSLCFSCQYVNKDGDPGPWLVEAFLISVLQPLNGFWWNIIGSKYSKSSAYLCFFLSIRWWQPWPLITWDIFNFSSTAEQILRKLDRNLEAYTKKYCLFHSKVKLGPQFQDIRLFGPLFMHTCMQDLGIEHMGHPFSIHTSFCLSFSTLFACSCQVQYCSVSSWGDSYKLVLSFHN